MKICKKHLSGMGRCFFAWAHSSVVEHITFLSHCEPPVKIYPLPHNTGSIPVAPILKNETVYDIAKKRIEEAKENASSFCFD